MKKFFSDGTSNINNKIKELMIENDLRTKNIKLSEENKKLKNLNQKIEYKIASEVNNLHSNQIIVKEKEKLKKSINRNSLMIYRILNDIKDIYSLNNKINKLNSIYDGIKLDKLIYDNQILKYEKEKTEIKKQEISYKNNNLNLIYNNSLQKKKNDQEIRYTYENIIDAFNFRNNYIYNENEANKKIDFLLNQKQQLIENKINLINIINKNKNKKENKDLFDLGKANEDLNKLKLQNKNLKNELNKFNNIIKNLNTSLESNNDKKNLEIGLDKKIEEANEYKDKINHEIDKNISLKINFIFFLYHFHWIFLLFL